MQAGIPYTVDAGEKLVNETFGPNNIRRRTSGNEQVFPVQIEDGRASPGSFRSTRTASSSSSTRPRYAIFSTRASSRTTYYPEVAALIQKISGAKRVHVFDHTLRSGNESEREARLIREPVLSAHNDYTEWSGPNRVKELMGSEADMLLASRFAIIQVWRAINQPIESNPLALADAKSIAPEDLLVAERRYPHRVGQTYRLKYSPSHRWFYFPRMRRDEALVFKVYDSEKDGRARFTPHTSFVDPTTPPGAPPRQSIEARALVFF